MREIPAPRGRDLILPDFLVCRELSLTKPQTEVLRYLGERLFAGRVDTDVWLDLCYTRYARPALGWPALARLLRTLIDIGLIAYSSFGSERHARIRLTARGLSVLHGILVDDAVDAIAMRRNTPLQPGIIYQIDSDDRRLLELVEDTNVYYWVVRATTSEPFRSCHLLQWIAWGCTPVDLPLLTPAVAALLRYLLAAYRSAGRLLSTKTDLRDACSAIYGSQQAWPACCRVARSADDQDLLRFVGASSITFYVSLTAKGLAAALANERSL